MKNFYFGEVGESLRLTGCYSTFYRNPQNLRYWFREEVKIFPVYLLTVLAVQVGKVLARLGIAKPELVERFSDEGWESCFVIHHPFLQFCYFGNWIVSGLKGFRQFHAPRVAWNWEIPATPEKEE